MEDAPLSPRRTTSKTLPPVPRRASEMLGAADWPPEAERIAADVTSRDFFQTVRLLERLFPDRAPVGGFADPRDEVVRFSANPSTAFPASEILELEAPWARATPPRMTVNFFGLHGPQGVMPLVYNAYVAERTRARDHALRDFLDIFNHRLISLFYRAWEKTHVDVMSERPARVGESDGGRDGGSDGARDPFSQHLLDLVGLGTARLQGRQPLDDRAMLQYAGLLAPQPRSAAALEQLIEDYFDVPAELEQFVGGWFAIDESTQCRLDDADASAQLGAGAVAGDEVWDAQSRVRLRLGPLSRRQYDQFLPGGDAHERLRGLVRFYTGDEYEVELQLVLARDEVPAFVLGEGGGVPLGWSTWLRSAPMARDPDETVLIL